MHKAYIAGMQRASFYAFILTAIEKIPYERMPYMRHMHPYLMRPSRIQPQPQKGRVSVFLNNAVMRHRTLAIRCNNALYRGALRPHYGRINGALRRMGNAFCHRKIFPYKIPVQLLLQLFMSKGMHSKNRQPAGAFVQPVYYARNIIYALIKEICRNPSRKGIIPAPL